jgi:glycosyltransferase involved in cell wall biosynthesis
MSTKRKLKICFWGNVASALQGRNKGGGELQIALLAKSLAKAGHSVTLIDSEFKENETVIEGVRILPVSGWNEGVRVLRMFTRRIPQLYKELLHEKADIYYVRMQSHWNLIPYLAAKRLGAVFVIGCAHDLEAGSFWTRFQYYYLINHEYYRLLSVALPTEIITPYLLRHAQLVIAQHDAQRAMFRKKGIQSKVFPNVIDIKKLDSVKSSEKNGFIFVGSLDVNKGLRELIEIASLSPRVKFTVVGQPRGRLSGPLVKSLISLSNVEYLGRLDHDSTIEQIAKSKALLCTSRFEGFPNIFLEAWSVGTPVLSLWVNPGDILNKHRLGRYFNGDIKSFVSSLQEDAGTKSEDLVRYVEEYHSSKSAGERFLAMLSAGISAISP